MASDYLTPMLLAVHEILAKGDETIDLLMLSAHTPEELVIARAAEAAIHAHAHVIRRLIESQLQLDEGLNQIVQRVEELSD